MILGDPQKWDAYAEEGIYGQLTLDELLRRTAAAFGDDTAVVSAHAGKGAVELTWSDLDVRADRLAHFLLDLGLKQDDLVIVLAGASSEALVSLFGLTRAGMIAMPLTPAMGTPDIGDIASRLGAKAIITEAHTGPRATANTAALAAFSAFDVRFLLGFGDDLPDGVIALDSVIAGDLECEAFKGPMRGGRAADHVALVTVDTTGNHRSFAARNHGQLVAAALPVVAYGRLDRDETIASAMVPCSLASIAGVILPWLLTRCRLLLLPSWDAEGLAANAASGGATIVALPGALENIAGEALAADMRVIRLWRGTVLVRGTGASADDKLLDVVSLGEAGLIVHAAGTVHNHIPLDGLRLGGTSGSSILEPRVQGILHKAGSAIAPGSMLRGPLAVRGPGTPVMAYPRDEAGKDDFSANGFMQTGLRGEVVDAEGPGIQVLGALHGEKTSGGLPVDLAMADSAFAALASVSDAAALMREHPVLGGVVAMAYVSDGPVEMETIEGQLDALGCAANLYPVELVRVKAIPRDTAGNVLRGDLAALRLAG